MTDETSEILAADQRFFRALLATDLATLERLLAPDFLLVDVAAGGVVPRATLLELLRAGEVRFDSIDSSSGDTIVRRYGSTALVVGRTTMSATTPDGSSFTTESRYTHVFVLNDNWMLVSAQGTRITDSQVPK